MDLYYRKVAVVVAQSPSHVQLFATPWTATVFNQNETVMLLNCGVGEDS